MIPIVKSSAGHLRRGKGFSLLELSHVGLSLNLARKLRIPIDRRRKTSYVENVKKLRKLLDELKV